MEVNLKDLMDKSDITTDDLDYIIERLWDKHFCCYELTSAFIKAYARGRNIRDRKGGAPPHYKRDVDAAIDISDWVERFINHETDDGFP